jgi:hypothetical protein
VTLVTKGKRLFTFCTNLWQYHIFRDFFLIALRCKLTRQMLSNLWLGTRRGLLMCPRTLLGVPAVAAMASRSMPATSRRCGLVSPSG